MVSKLETSLLFALYPRNPANAQAAIKIATAPITEQEIIIWKVQNTLLKLLKERL